MNIDQFLNKSYNIYNNNSIKECGEDVKQLFEDLYKENRLLTGPQVNKFIMKLTKGKSRSIINNYYYSSLKDIPINYLTQKHLLTSKQVSRILECCKKYPEFTFDWVNNLLKLGYKLSNDEYLNLSNKGYTKIFDLNMNISFANNFFKNNYQNFDQCYEIIKKYNLVPNDETFKYLISQSGKLVNSYLNLHKFNEIKSLGYTVNSNTLSIIFDYYKSVYYNYPLDLINDLSDILIECINNDNDIFTKLYNIRNLVGTNTKSINLIYLTTKKIIEKKKINPTLDNFKLLLYSNNGSDNMPVENIYVVFFEELKYNPNENLCDAVCQIGDQNMFQYLIKKNIFKTSKNSLKCACQSRNKQIIEELINMKLIGDIDCIKSMNYIDKDIFNLLLLSGLSINLELITECYKKKFIIEDLRGIPYDDSMYYELYSNFGPYEFPVYYSKMDQSIIYFRDLFKKSTVSEIKEYMKLNKLVPDQYCYDKSLISCNNQAKSWLEQEYKFKPNYLTLVLSQDMGVRKEIIEKYIILNKFDNSTDYKKLYFKKN